MFCSVIGNCYRLSTMDEEKPEPLPEGPQIPTVNSGLSYINQKQKPSDFKQEAMACIISMNEAKEWDTLKAADVPGEITNYVIACVNKGHPTHKIRKTLGFGSATDKRWVKILASLRQGLRVNSTALMSRWITRNESLAERLFKLLDDLLARMESNPGEIDWKDEAKSVSMMLDTLGKMQMNTVKLGKDLGVFVDPTSEGGSGQITIVVQSGVPTPSDDAIEAHHRKIAERGSQQEE